MVYAAALGAQGICMLIGGVVEQKVGPKVTVALGGTILCIGTFLAAGATTLSEFIWYDGIFFGVGMGIAYTAPITCAIRWLPGEKGRVTGSIVAGFGGGALIFNQIAGHILNPNNESPTIEEESGTYFSSDSSVAQHVPTLYTVLGCCYTAFFVVGVMLTRDPETHEMPLVSIPPNGMHGSPVPTGREGTRSISLSPARSDDDLDEVIDNPAEDGRTGTGMSSHVYTGAMFNPLPQKLVKDLELAPVDIAVSPLSWQLAACFFLTTTGGMYFAGTFKTYGFNYFADDELLTNLATLSSLFNAGGRIGWGALGDRYGYATTLVYMATGFGIIQLTYPLSVSFGVTGFCTWTLLLFLFEGGNFCLYVPLLVGLFGVKHSAANYGLIFTVYSILNVTNIGILSSMQATFVEAALYCSLLVFCGVLLVMHLCLKVGWPVRGLDSILDRLRFQFVMT